MSTACKALILIGGGIWTLVNLLMFANDAAYENDCHTCWAPAYYRKLRKYLTPFGAFIPTLFLVCFTPVYQILFALLKGFKGIKELWLTIFKRQDEEI